MYPYRDYSNYYTDDRFIGGAAGPFILGALTGGAAFSLFNPYRPRPIFPVPGPGFPRPPMMPLYPMPYY